MMWLVYLWYTLFVLRVERIDHFSSNMYNVMSAPGIINIKLLLCDSMPIVSPSVARTS